MPKRSTPQPIAHPRTFQMARGTAVECQPQSIAAGLYDSIAISRGKGDGTFRKAVDYKRGHFFAFVAVGDFNGNGKPDLAVANSGSNSVSILTNVTP